MILQIPTRWMTVLFFVAATLTYTACSKDQSLEKNKYSVFDHIILPDIDSTGNNGDSTNNDGDSTGNNGGGDTTGGNGNTTSVTDVEFMKQATYVNRAQVTNAKLAIERGTSAAVRDFGTALQLRFGEAQADIEKLAITLSITLPATTDAAHSSMTNSLSDMEGKTFDISYVDYQMLELQKAIDLYAAEIDNGTDARVKAYANKYLPYLRDFLQTASTIRQSL